jgi:hypothetical protein
MLGRNAETGALTTVNDMPVKSILTSGQTNLVILERVTVTHFLEEISCFAEVIPYFNFMCRGFENSANFLTSFKAGKFRRHG